MSQNTYQTYSFETPIDTMRSDFIRRKAMCAALAGRYSVLQEVGSACDAIVVQIDARRAELQGAEDALVRAKALEDAEKIDAVGAYATARAMMGAQDRSKLFAFLPEPPSSLGRMPSSRFSERLSQAISNLRKLPEEHPVRKEYLGKLEAEQGAFDAADRAEDEVREQVRGLRLGLLVYRSELARVRDAQLGAVQAATGDRSITAQFTIPWRRWNREGADDDGTAPATPPVSGTPGQNA